MDTTLDVYYLQQLFTNLIRLKCLFNIHVASTVTAFANLLHVIEASDCLPS